MEHQESSDEIFEQFTWKIENFSKLNNVLIIRSKPFFIGGYSWRINLYPNGMHRDEKVSIGLEALQIQTDDNVSKGWSRDGKFRLVVLNQLDTKRTIVKEFKTEFNATSRSWGYSSLMPSVELNDPKKGFVVKDACIVRAEVFVGKKATNENRVSQTASLTGHSNTVDEACKDLQVLWDELKTFGTDHAWLERHVRSALGVKVYVEKALHVEKLKTKLVAAEQNHNKKFC